LHLSIDGFRGEAMIRKKRHRVEERPQSKTLL